MKYFLIFIVKSYQYAISPMIGHQCRFTPTCSHYALESLTKYGTVKGVFLSIKRIIKCHPWHVGGHDPLP